MGHEAGAQREAGGGAAARLLLAGDRARSRGGCRSACTSCPARARSSRSGRASSTRSSAWRSGGCARTSESPPETYPWPCEHCSRCEFIPVCAERWKDDDHLSLVAAIRRDQIERLNGSGVSTLAGLAGSPSELRVPRLAPPMLERLRDQAGLQLHRRETGELTRRLLEPEPERGLGLLPAPSPGDLFFDMEGDPFFEAAGGLEFLFGVLWRRPDGTAEYQALRAHDRETERRAFEGFVDLVVERLREHPDLHVYHYAAYEPATLSRLMGAHATREAEIDELLRREVLVDLYRVVRQSLRAGVAIVLAQGDRAVLLHAHRERAVGQRRRAPLRAVPLGRRRGAARGDRGVQRGGLRRDARAARLAARAARGGRGPVRRGDPVPAAAGGARAQRGAGGARRDGRAGRGAGGPRRGRARAGRAPARLPPARGAPGLVVVLPALRDDRRRAARGLRGARRARVGRARAGAREEVARVRVHVSAAAARVRPRRHGRRPGRGRHGLDDLGARQRGRRRAAEAREAATRRAAADGARAGRAVRDEGSARSAAAARRVDARRRRPLPGPAAPAAPRPPARRRPRPAHGAGGAARARRLARPLVPVRPGPARLGEDLPGRADRHGAAAGGQARRGRGSEPQGDPQPAGRDRGRPRARKGSTSAGSSRARSTRASSSSRGRRTTSSTRGSA